MLKKEFITTALSSAIIAMTSMTSMASANAELNIFTEHQAVSMFNHGVNKGDDVRFKTGDYPYLGQVGLEYKFKNTSYSLSYIHRSNIDIIKGDEYNYNGIALGIKYSHCLAYCK